MNPEILSAYLSLSSWWASVSEEKRKVLLDRFKIGYSFNSGNIENPEITYHDTAEVFSKDGVSNFTGSIRTIYEINNLKHSWEWLEDAIGRKAEMDSGFILDAHRVLTRGTYDETRWAQGERPGTFKINDYRVANDVGLLPSEVEEAISSLVSELSEVLVNRQSPQDALTIAAYAHACLVDIHPFADGNGRVARLLMNYILLRLDQMPCIISASDRLAYFGALDAFHEGGNLEPFKDFLLVQTIKTWNDLG